MGGDTWSLLVWTTSNVTGVKGDGLGHEFETRGKEGENMLEEMVGRHRDPAEGLQEVPAYPCRHISSPYAVSALPCSTRC